MKTLVSKGDLQYAPLISGSCIYALKALPGGRVFFYSMAGIHSRSEILKNAERNLSSISFWRRNGAYLEGVVVWDSGDSWKPNGRVTFVWKVYRLSDSDPKMTTELLY